MFGFANNVKGVPLGEYNTNIFEREKTPRKGHCLYLMHCHPIKKRKK